MKRFLRKILKLLMPPPAPPPRDPLFFEVITKSERERLVLFEDSGELHPK